MEYKNIIYRINFVIKDNINTFLEYVSNIKSIKNISYHINDKGFGKDIYVEYGDNYYFIIDGKEYNDLEILLDKELVLPELFLSHLNIEEYSKKLASLEHRKNYLFNIEKAKIDKVINKNLNVFKAVNSPGI